MAILLVSSDLMAASQLEGAARSVGQELIVATASRAEQRAAGSCANLVVIDLASIDDCGALVRSLRSTLAEATRIVAFGPHVHTARLEMARAAGCDAVFTRGQFLQRAAQVLALD